MIYTHTHAQYKYKNISFVSTMICKILLYDYMYLLFILNTDWCQYAGQIKNFLNLD